MRSVKWITLVAAFMLSSSATAESSTEEEHVVRAMIVAARDDHLEAFLSTVDIARVASSSHGECTAETLRAIGKILARTETSLETKRHGDIRAVRVTGRNKITAVFGLSALSKTMERPEGGLIITAVQIHFPSDDE